VLHAADEPVEDEQRDQQPQQGPEREGRLDATDEIRHDEGLRQGGGCAHDGQADRRAEHATVRGEVGEEVGKSGARTSAADRSRERPTTDRFTHERPYLL
jgi:hypothetical protein